MSFSLDARHLLALHGTAGWPTVVCVTRRQRFLTENIRIAGSVWRDHMATDDWGPSLSRCGEIVVHCVHGHNVSQLAAARLRASGIAARYLEGGLEAWRAIGGPVVAREGIGVPMALETPTVWVTRSRPKIDRIACPWLIRRFIDPHAVFHFVEAEWVRDIAEEMGGIPFDIDGIHYTHRGEGCTFDALLGDFGLDSHPHLAALAPIVRGADTARPDLAPECAGLLAISLGLSAIEPDDDVQLGKGIALYDALYGWIRHARTETHNWPSAQDPAA